jgi:hypothetical protein
MSKNGKDIAHEVNMEIFNSSYSVNENGCWVWKNSSSHGYGSIALNRTIYRAHRVSFKIFKGDLVPGLVIDHTCRNKACVNPEHLRQVSQKENLQRTKKLKEVCKRGHFLKGENLYMKGSQRTCRECKKIYAKKYKLKLKQTRQL